MDAQKVPAEDVDAVTVGGWARMAVLVSTREPVKQSAKVWKLLTPAMGPRAPTVPCDTRFDMVEPSVEGPARELKPRDSAFFVSRLVGLFGSER